MFTIKGIIKRLEKKGYEVRLNDECVGFAMSDFEQYERNLLITRHDMHLADLAEKLSTRELRERLVAHGIGSLPKTKAELTKLYYETCKMG